MSSSLARGLMVLDLLVAEGRPLRLTDIAQALSISKSGLHGLLATLVECGYVEHLPGGIYQLGFQVLAGRQSIPDRRARERRGSLNGSLGSGDS